MKLQVERDHIVGLFRAAGISPERLLDKTGEVKNELRADADGRRVGPDQQELNMLLAANRAFLFGDKTAMAA